jgi:hypothetical protein
VRLRSNSARKMSSESSLQAQYNGICSVFFAYTERKLNPREILDIYALVHYTLSELGAEEKVFWGGFRDQFIHQ